MINAFPMSIFIQILVCFASIAHIKVSSLIHLINLFRFRCISSHLLVQPKRAESIVLACCCLHNMLRSRVITPPGPGPIQTELPTCSLEGLSSATGTARIHATAKSMRDYITEYVNTPQGKVSWQDDRI